MNFLVDVESDVDWTIIPWLVNRGYDRNRSLVRSLTRFVVQPKILSWTLLGNAATLPNKIVTITEVRNNMECEEWPDSDMIYFLSEKFTIWLFWKIKTSGNVQKMESDTSIVNSVRNRFPYLWCLATFSPKSLRGLDSNPTPVTNITNKSGLYFSEQYKEIQ